MYVQFAGTAMDLDKQEDKNAIFFVKLTPFIVGTYILIQIINVNLSGTNTVYLVAKIIIRIYLLLLGLIMLLIVMRKRRLIYYRYLGGGALSMIIFGLISSLANLRVIGSLFISPLSWLMIGFFADVIFFSSAIGYRIKKESAEKEEALTTILLQKEALQRKEIEKLQAIFQAREEERLRIAKDLHDDVGATLSGIRVFSQLAKERPVNSTEYLDKINNYSDDMLDKMSDIIWSINAGENSFEHMISKLRRYALTITSAKNIQLIFQVDPAVQQNALDMNLRKNIYLISKEAINNAVKYAECSSIQVMLRPGTDMTELVIADNGKGFNSGEATEGNGLLNMQRRAEEINGEITIETAPGKGTLITVSFNFT
jgi:signal transduction histidine kinase